MAPLLAYWDIRGLAQPIRLLLAYTGTQFEDKRYVTGPAPSFDKTCWFSIKETLGFDFPNLPYYIDGDVKLTQSGAIIRHVARKHNLLGTTSAEQDRVDLMDCQINDFRETFVGLCYTRQPQYDAAREEYLKVLPDKIKKISLFLGSNPYFGGNNITFVDFIVYEMLDQHKAFAPGCLNAFENLQAFTERIEALPTVATYMKSEEFLKKPFNNRMATFGSEQQ